MVLLALLVWLGCAVSSAPPQVSLTDEGIAVSAEAGIVSVALIDPDGVPLVRQRPPSPLTHLGLQVRLVEVGTYAVEVQTQQGAHTLLLPIAAPPPPLTVTVEAPVGQGRLAVTDGAVVPLTLIDGAPAQVAVTLTAARAGEAAARLGEQTAARSLRSGERLVAMTEVDGPVQGVAQLDDTTISFTIAPRILSAAQAREVLQLEEVVFPAGPDGRTDPTRPAGRVTLPSTWWRSMLSAAGLGFRPRDGGSPWAWQGVTLRNTGERDVSVAIRARILDAHGQPEPAFRPRMRDGDDGSGAVAVLLKVPAGQRATAALPLYVDPALLTADDAAEAQWRRVIDVTPLGASVPLLIDEAPLYVSRGSVVASAGLVVALVAALLGSALLLRRGPVWLARAQTSELMTIALFGALGFLVSAAGRLLGTGVAAVLGPFSVLLTGLIDDVFRYALLATLLTLLPRPGTAALAALTHWLLSGIALGTFGPTDVLFVGGRVLWLEGALWLVGITRPTGWRDSGAVARWLRLAAGFGAASIATSATGLVLHVVLYRLFLADWYVAMVLVGPGFLYVVLACALAVPFADSLRRIQR